MGGILGGRTNAKQQKAVGSLQFQTSQQGGVIPLVYGTTRLSGNLLDYDDFRATASSKTGGEACVDESSSSRIGTLAISWFCFSKILLEQAYGT